MTDTPTARAMFEQLAQQIRFGSINSRREIADTIEAIVNETLYRAQELKPRAEPTATPMSKEIAIGIRQLVHNKPHLSNLEVGAAFGVNPARVSDALQGKY